MIPKNIHQVHFGGGGRGVRWSDDAVSFRDHNPGFIYWLWDEHNCSSLLGLVVEELHEKYGNWASVSNYVRLVALREFGGIYADTDCRCLKPLDGLLVHVAFAAFQDGHRICNAVMGAEARHPWVQWQLDHWNDFDQADAASGVYLATAAPPLGVTIIAQHLVYPWLYGEPVEKQIPHSESLMLHRWAGSWVKK